MKADPPIPDELWRQIPPAAQAAILALIQHYEQRLAELEARLNQNYTYSSKPPSSDPPGVKRAPSSTPSAKNAGGQPGHAKAQRALVDHPYAIDDCKPPACRHCRLMRPTKKPFVLWQKVRDGTLSRVAFVKQIKPIRPTPLGPWLLRPPREPACEPRN